MAGWLYNLLHGWLPGSGFLGRSAAGSGPAALLSGADAVGLLPAATPSTDGKMTAAQAQSVANSAVAGSNGQVQYNNNGTLGADSSFTWDSVNKKLSVTGDGIRSAGGFDFYPVTAPIFSNSNLSTASGGVNLTTGNYYYSVTYLTALGETNTSAYGLIAVTSGQKVVINVPISTDTRVTGRRIYRTPAGLNQWDSKVLVTINNNTASSYTDDIADGSLTGNTAYFRSNTTSKYLTVNGFQIFNLTQSNDANAFFGYNVGNNTLTNGRNVGFGYGIMPNITSGGSNVGIGSFVMNSLTTGSFDIGIGYGASAYLTTGTDIVAIGNDALIYNSTGVSNVALGSYSSFGAIGNNISNSVAVGVSANFTGKSGGVYLGNNAGRYETENNKLFIDNRDRVNEANARNCALIYGVFDSTPSNQILSLGGGGNVVIGRTITPTAKTNIIGSTSDNTAYGLKVDDSSNSKKFYIRNDGQIDSSGSRIIGYQEITSDTTLTQSSKSVAVCNPAGTGQVLTMHLSPPDGIKQRTVNSSGFAVTLGRNSQKMAGLEANYTLPAHTAIDWQYYGATIGWLPISISTW